MENSIMDEGLIEVILAKLERQRLPRLLALKEKVDGGCSLEDFDLDFFGDFDCRCQKNDITYKQASGVSGSCCACHVSF